MFIQTILFRKHDCIIASTTKIHSKLRKVDLSTASHACGKHSKPLRIIFDCGSITPSKQYLRRKHDTETFFSYIISIARIASVKSNFESSVFFSWGNIFIYPVINWSKPEQTIVVAVLTGLFLALMHIVTVAIATARDLIARRCLTTHTGIYNDAFDA